MFISFNAFGKHAQYNDGLLYIEGQCVGMFKGLKEAKEYCHGLSLSEELLDEIVTEKRELTEDDIAIVLKENGEMRVTEELINNFKELVETKHFFPSNSLITIRENIGLTHFNKIDYVLRDGTTVLLDIDTNRKLNSIIGLDEITLKYMLSNGTNFLSVVNRLLED